MKCCRRSQISAGKTSGPDAVARTGRESVDTPSSDFEELLAYFNARSARAIIVGGHALAFHGRPRFTKDLDVFVEASADNAARVLDALRNFGFGDAGLTLADFSTPGPIVQLGVPPNRIDLLTTIDGVTFEEAWAGRAAGSAYPPATALRPRSTV